MAGEVGLERLQSNVTAVTSVEAGLCSDLQSGQPILWRVGHLGGEYERWLQRPCAGQPRFFSNSLAENFTKTPWWVVPLIWVPVTCALIIQVRLGLSTSVTMVRFLINVLLSQAVEYGIHRFIFHVEPQSYWTITLNFLFHGCHHKFPLDKQRLVFPPVPAAAVAGVLYYISLALLGHAHALPFFTGIVAGYICYDCSHYAMHHGIGTRSVWWLKALRRAHLGHHYQHPSAAFGISSPLFDILLRTRPV